MTRAKHEDAVSVTNKVRKAGTGRLSRRLSVQFRLAEDTNQIGFKLDGRWGGTRSLIASSNSVAS